MRLFPYPVAPYLGAWGIAALYNITHDILTGPPSHVIVFNAAHFAAWIVMGLVVVPLVRRWPVTRSPLSWVRQLALGSVFTMLDVTFGHWVGMRTFGLMPHGSIWQIAQLGMRDCFHMGLINYFGLVAATQLVDAWHRERAQRVREADLRTAWGEAQLRHLRSQMHPHFLFNALHTVGALMHRDLPAAERVLDRLALLLRLSLRETDQTIVELRTELAFVQAYCEIEKTRFEHRLDVEVAVPAELQGAAIPPLILQPLVENAIKHGVSPHPQGGRVTVRAWHESDTLVLEVENAVRGAAPHDAPRTEPASPRPGLGLALENIRTRLQTLYGGASGLELRHAGSGAIARITLPWTTLAAGGLA